MDVETVDLVRAGKVPEGASLVTRSPGGAPGGSGRFRRVLNTLVNTLQAWLTRHERRSVILEIEGDKLELTGVSSENNND